MIRSFDHDPPYPGLDRLLRQAGLQGRADNVPARFAGDLARAVFTGAPYPRPFIQALINRIRLDRDTRKPFHQKINYERAALLKAFLLRQARFYQKPWEVSMALDEHNPHPAYRFGRLFAVLEKAQEDASPGLNSTIKDRFFGGVVDVVIDGPNGTSVGSVPIDFIDSAKGAQEFVVPLSTINGAHDLYFVVRDTRHTGHPLFKLDWIRFER